MAWVHLSQPLNPSRLEVCILILGLDRENNPMTTIVKIEGEFKQEV